MRSAVLVLLACLSIGAPLAAQWAPFPSRGVPRTPSGEPDLSAPAPRTADGTPDLSGVWTNYGQSPLSFGSGGSAGSPLPDGTAPGGFNQFRDIASGLKDGLPFRQSALALRNQRMADYGKDNPDAHCLPMGLMQFHTHPAPRKIVQTPGVILILYEANSGIRQILTDGRPLPANDPQPWWYGYSTGKWEGDTLVVQTSGFRDDGWLDIVGTPLTSAAKWTERFRRINVGALEIEVTVDDPKAYTKPWTVTIKQRLLPNEQLMEFVCGENERSSHHFR
jgi:hypothetical protein